MQSSQSAQRHPVQVEAPRPAEFMCLPLRAVYPRIDMLPSDMLDTLMMIDQKTSNRN